MLEIYNILLDLINLYQMTKTKTAMILILAGTVTFFVGLWLYSTMDDLGTFEYVVAGAVTLMVAFSAYIGFKRINDEKKGLPADDEMSEMIKQKAAASAFAYSFYAWLAILFFTLDSNLDIEVPIGIGILAMGILFIGFWMYYLQKGLSDENPH